MTEGRELPVFYCPSLTVACQGGTIGKAPGQHDVTRRSGGLDPCRHLDDSLPILQSSTQAVGESWYRSDPLQ